MEIILTTGEVTVVDDCDSDLAERSWHKHSKGYAASHQTLMHVLIAERAGLDTSKHIDHKDRDKLNNRRENLRVATPSQSQGNTGLRANNSSGYKGVSFNKRLRKWQAKCAKVHLGFFNTPQDAARAYDRAARNRFGEFAATNFQR